MFEDLVIVVRWFIAINLIGLLAYPLTKKIFTDWYDKGYLFSKALGLALVTYIVFVLGILHILPFSLFSIFSALFLVFIVGIFHHISSGFSINDAKNFLTKKRHLKINHHLLIILAEESFFLISLVFWSWIKAHEPSIHGLEKFMDFGFTKSILNSQYFPAPDMWYAGSSINYYYFGHTALAVLTKLSFLDLSYTFNLILSTIFAFTITMSFGLIYQLIKNVPFSILTAYIVTLGGNLQTIYAFTKGYKGEDTPPAFWTIFTGKLDPNYWYANATRFIPYTIHEFPSYSFVVSDIHGHVLSLPFVLLAIGLIFNIFIYKKHQYWIYFLYGLLVSILLMTNALDGPIYLGLFLLLLLFVKSSWVYKIQRAAFTSLVVLLASYPFLFHFKSFVSGISLNCPPVFLQNHKIGPFLFEGVEKCQHSPLWMWLILWGFFIYSGVWFFIKLRPRHNVLVAIFFLYSLGLIIFPEFFYFKDIYPQHFRSNTMFKLGYQAFIIFGFVSGYTIYKLRRTVFYVGLVPLLFLVLIYPYFSVQSYFGNLKNYKGLNGTSWIKQQYPDDFEAIRWLNKNVKKQSIIVEADGDSYTDYNRISTFTGLPTIVGWAVHEWLWRSTYDVVAPRREEVRQIYELEDVNLTRQLLEKYDVRYIVVGSLERTKYTALNEVKIQMLSKEVFRSGDTVIYFRLPKT